jgi:MFS family permease
MTASGLGTVVAVLTKFYGISPSAVPYYLIPFAFGNILGPLLLGRLFDTKGRVLMIAGCYFVCGVLMTLTGYLFYIDVLNATTQTIMRCIVFSDAMIELALGIRAEGQSLENVATPLTVIEEATGTSAAASSATR